MKFVTAVLISLVLVTSAKAEIAADNMGPAGYVHSGYHIGIGYRNLSIGFTNEAAGQEFVVNQGGELAAISATVSPFYGGQPLKVSLFTARSGLPGQLLGSVSVADTEFSGALNRFDFSGLGINLVAGEHYVVTFSVAIGNQTTYRALLTQTNEYSFGIPSLFSRDSVSFEPSRVAPEIGVVVEVNPQVPEPLEVDVNISPEKLNLKSKKPKPLEAVVFGSADLDVSDIDPDTILLGDPELTDSEGGTGMAVPPVGGFIDDVDGDGWDDLVAEFNLTEMKDSGAIDSASTGLLLDAQLSNGGRIYGADTINSGGQGKGKQK